MQGPLGSPGRGEERASELRLEDPSHVGGSVNILSSLEAEEGGS